MGIKSLARRALRIAPGDSEGMMEARVFLLGEIDPKSLSVGVNELICPLRSACLKSSRVPGSVLQTEVGLGLIA